MAERKNWREDKVGQRLYEARQTVENLLPHEARMRVSNHIRDRISKELPAPNYADRSNAVLPAIGVAVVISLTVQLTGSPFTPMILAFNVGLPCAVAWFSLSVVSAREASTERRSREIAAEEWNRALAETGRRERYPT